MLMINARPSRDGPRLSRRRPVGTGKNSCPFCVNNEASRLPLPAMPPPPSLCVWQAANSSPTPLLLSRPRLLFLRHYFRHRLRPRPSTQPSPASSRSDSPLSVSPSNRQLALSLRCCRAPWRCAFRLS
eukprot:5327932-Pleurochrysis_carterae.AAC.1